MKPRFCEPVSPKTMEMGKSFKFLEPKCDFSDTAFVITSGGWWGGVFGGGALQLVVLL